MPALAGFRVPHITHEELFGFHESHFSHVSVADFGTKFTALQEPAKGHDEGDIEAAAPDGAEDAGGPGDYGAETALDLDAAAVDVSAQDEDGEVPEDESERTDDRPSKKRRRKKNSNDNGNGSSGYARGARRNEEKPDLRKRTWDVVETGLGSLDYDGAEAAAGSLPAAPQRRRVQYGDD